MARPKKQGVDYFPLNVNMDSKIKFLKIRFGMLGFGTLIALYQNIYANGYYCDWNNDDVLLFANDVKLEVETLHLIVEECFNRSIFSRACYDNFKILTSSGVQKQYMEIASRRKCLHFDNKYLVDVDNNLVNVDNNSKNVNNGTQIEIEIEIEKETKQQKTQNVNIYDRDGLRDFWVEEFKKIIIAKNIRDDEFKGGDAMKAFDNAYEYMVNREKPVDKPKPYLKTVIVKNFDKYVDRGFV